MSFESFSTFFQTWTKIISALRDDILTYGVRCDVQDEAEEISANLPLLISKLIREISINPYRTNVENRVSS